MTRLHDLIGVECELGRVGDALRQFAQEVAAPVVGAYHVTCSDEAERECAEALQRWFVREVLPELKPDNRAPFRSINLGGRYEWGAVRVAEQHFATPAARGAFKLLLVKINAHVAVRPAPGGVEYGWFERFGRKSACCGALAQMFGDSDLPAIGELRETFRFEGVDRLAVLADRSRIDPRHRALLAAVTNARLQAQRAVLDVRQYQPESPTMFLVLPCVTINHPGPDTEVVVGQYGIDRTEETPVVKYRGLGDDPSAYQVRHDQGLLIIEDGGWPATRS